MATRNIIGISTIDLQIVLHPFTWALPIGRCKPALNKERLLLFFGPITISFYWVDTQYTCWDGVWDCVPFGCFVISNVQGHPHGKNWDGVHTPKNWFEKMWQGVANTGHLEGKNNA